MTGTHSAVYQVRVSEYCRRFLSQSVAVTSV